MLKLAPEKIVKTIVIVICVGVLVYFASDFHLNNRQSDLHVAARMGYLPKVIEILESGVSVNTKDERGENALWEAVQHRHYKLADYLISRGISVSEKNVMSETLKDYCSKRGMVECTDWLKNRKGSSN